MSNSGLIVRRSERYEVSLPARVRVGMSDIESVQFAKGVADLDRWIEVDVVDFAQGGVGFISDIFCARGLSFELDLQTLSPRTEESSLRCMLQVKRVQMTDRRPAYLVGCSFVGADDNIRNEIESIIRCFEGSVDGNSGGGG